MRSLLPLDTRTILAETVRTGRLLTVEENPRLCGRGAKIMPIAAGEAPGSLTGPPARITAPHIPLSAADAPEDHALPSAERITPTVRRSLEDT